MDAGDPFLCVYIWDERSEGRWPLGGASRVWLDGSLRALADALEERGGALHVYAGDTLKVLEALAPNIIYAHRRYEPAARALEAKVSRQFHLELFNGHLLFDPMDAKPYQVFTPFWNALHKWGDVPAPEPAPREVKTARVRGGTSDWGILPEGKWVKWLQEANIPGWKEGQRRLRTFARKGATYPKTRDALSEEGTSRLSPHLHFGEVSIREAWHSVDNEVFRKELAWREFAYQMVVYFPTTPEAPLREAYEKFPWKPDRRKLRAWQQGRTGYPVVDAGMRQLQYTGWMHNRARMIVASFLVKHLLQPWQRGAEWFWDFLVDADLASNTLGWQWSAGCGPDAAPFFRIFNPMEQGRKFDPEGDYVRAHVPELKRVPTEYIHAPWEAPAELLERAGVRLGKEYPEPIVDHKEARAAALKAFERIKRA